MPLDNYFPLPVDTADSPSFSVCSWRFADCSGLTANCKLITANYPHLPFGSVAKTSLIFIFCAISIISTTFCIATVRSTDKTIVSSAVMFLYPSSVFCISSIFTGLLLTVYFRSCVMVTEIVFFETDWPEDDFGSNSLITFGLVIADAIRKNNSRKNMMSFIAEVWISAEIRPCLFLRFICLALLTGQ